MAVYLRKNRYYYRRQIDGRDYHRSLGIKKGQERMLSALIQRADEAIVAEANGLERPLKTGRVMFSDFAEHTFLPAHAHKKSYNNDASEISVMLDLIGDHPLGSIGRREVERLEKALLKSRSTTTANRYMALLRHIFNHAIDEGLVRDNPVKCYVPYIEEPKRRSLTDDEIAAVLCAADAVQSCLSSSKTQAHIYDIIVVALNTGMRLGEILNLRWENIRDGLILLPYSQTKSRRRGVGEKARAKAIPINEVVRQVLDAQAPGEFVFDIDRGRDHSSIKRTIAEIRRLSGVREFTMHYLRHSVSTRLAASVSIAAAKEMLGHANLQTTLRYTHPGLDEKVSGVAILGAAFRNITSK